MNVIGSQNEISRLGGIYGDCRKSDEQVDTLVNGSANQDSTAKYNRQVRYLISPFGVR